MSQGYFTSSELIKQVKLLAFIPTSQSTFTDADFLQLANTEIKLSLAATLMQYHEEYMVRDAAPITIVANQSSYPIPYRAIGGKFRDIFFQDNNTSLYKMSRIAPENRPFFQDTTCTNRYQSFYLSGNDVVLIPSVSDNPTGSLLFSYYMRPNELVDESRVATIKSVAVGLTTTQFSVDNVPSNLTSFVQDGVLISGFSVNAKMDILQRKPGHKTIVFDINPVSVDGTNKIITFNNEDLVNTIIPGDYIAFAGECIIPQIPSDLQDVLCQRVVLRCLQAMGDQANYQVAQAKLQEMQLAVGIIIDNRSEGQSKKVLNLNSPIRNASLRKRSWC